METGSEPLLRPDGTFAWYISYGAWIRAQGTWLRDGDAVVLTASQPDRSAPLFALPAWTPGMPTRSRLLGRQHDDATAAWEERCGSAAEAVTAVVAPLVDDAPATAPVEASPPMADPTPAPTRCPAAHRQTRRPNPPMRPPCRPIAGRAASASRSLPSRTASAWA
jgi:hypothetical protein